MPYKKIVMALTVTLVILAGILAALISIPPADRQVSATNVTTNKTADIGGSFALINQNGDLVDSRSYDSAYKLVFFGFTYCPEICPASLQKITLALRQIGVKADDIQPVFISIDPERDSPDVIKEYLAAFHPRFDGFTGTMEQVRDVQERYRVYAQKTQSEGASTYSMDHSSYIYMTGPDDTVIDVIRADLDVTEISDAIAGLLD